MAEHCLGQEDSLKPNSWSNPSSTDEWQEKTLQLWNYISTFVNSHEDIDYLVHVPVSLKFWSIKNLFRIHLNQISEIGWKAYSSKFVNHEALSSFKWLEFQWNRFSVNQTYQVQIYSWSSAKLGRGLALGWRYVRYRSEAQSLDSVASILRTFYSSFLLIPSCDLVVTAWPVMVPHS